MRRAIKLKQILILLSLFIQVHEGIAMEGQDFSLESVPLMSDGLRNRQRGVNLNENISQEESSLTNTVSCHESIGKALLDLTFSPLGESWELFMNEKYEKAFPAIYLGSFNNPSASYLLGLYYEYDLKPMCRSLEDASRCYTRAIRDSQDPFLTELSIKALDRVIFLQKNPNFVPSLTINNNWQAL
jgi:hypothetical protein